MAQLWSFTVPDATRIVNFAYFHVVMCQPLHFPPAPLSPISTSVVLLLIQLSVLRLFHFAPTPQTNHTNAELEEKNQYPPEPLPDPLMPSQTSTTEGTDRHSSELSHNRPLRVKAVRGCCIIDGLLPTMPAGQWLFEEAKWYVI